MPVTIELKKLYVEFFSRAAIVIFTIGIATPFVAEKLTLPLAIVATVAILFCLFISSFIAVTIRKDKEA